MAPSDIPSNGQGHKPSTSSQYTMKNGYHNDRSSSMWSSRSVQRDPEKAATKGGLSTVIQKSRRGLPTETGDGQYLQNKQLKFSAKDFRTLLKHPKILKTLIHSKATGALVDDKTYFMEHLIQLVSGLPDLSRTRKVLTDAFLDELWCNLQHPPTSYLGNDFSYRKADGSNNNILYPHIGKANTPYARSVQPITVLPAALPDPGLIFDSLFARENYKEHPNRVSSILFYWASIIIHDCFQTDHADWSSSQTSSYLDLSPLYGDIQEDQDKIRTFKDGKLKPDCFSEERLIAFPPGCGVILIMFNRFHNYVVEQLALINEGNRFPKPNSQLPADRYQAATKKYDEDLFQTGRLITCGLYINITLLDYLRTIVNLNRSNTTWTLDPRVESDSIFGKAATPRGVGNQVSAEFNLVYRWHSAISKKDELWTEELMKELFGKPAEEVPTEEYGRYLAGWYRSIPKDPHERPFAKLKRQDDGKFADDDLVEILTESIEDCAGAFGPNQVPKVLKAIEILGMKQSRFWGLATLNEFRAFFGLARHETFESVNRDPKVANDLRHLYNEPDLIELYPGLIAEEAKKPMVPGVGIAPTFTISRAILSDAVCLVRGDRFYTTDYNSKNLTNWGYKEVQYDLEIEQGCVFSKLFLRAFPSHFKYNSVYAHYPMTVPDENKKILHSLGRESHYTWERPRRAPVRAVITGYHGVKAVLEQQDVFKVIWGTTLTELFGKGGGNFMLSGDTPRNAKQRAVMGEALYRDKWHQQVKEFYEHITLKLLHEKTFTIAGRQFVDFTRDIGNLAHIHFASAVYNFPLKTLENPHGVITEEEMFMAFAIIFTAIFFDQDPAKSFEIHQRARGAAAQLGPLVETVIKTNKFGGIFSKKPTGHPYLSNYGVHMIKRLQDTGMDASEIAYSQVLPTAIAMVPNQAQVITQVMDFYLDKEKGAKHLPNMKRLAQLDTPAADDELLKYVMEGIRLNGTFGAIRKNESGVSQTIEGTTIQPDHEVLVSFVKASRDPTIFPDPLEVRTDRPLEKYINYGVGAHQCLGMEASRVALTAMLKTMLKLRGLRPAPGDKGVLKKIYPPEAGGHYVYMMENQESYFPFPLTWQLTWDGELPPLA